MNIRIYKVGKLHIVISTYISKWGWKLHECWVESSFHVNSNMNTSRIFYGSSDRKSINAQFCVQSYHITKPKSFTILYGWLGTWSVSAIAFFIDPTSKLRSGTKFSLVLHHFGHFAMDLFSVNPEVWNRAKNPFWVAYFQNNSLVWRIIRLVTCGLLRGSFHKLNVVLQTRGLRFKTQAWFGLFNN